MEYVPAKLSQVTFNKYLKQWENITEKTNLPFDMNDIEIRKYKPKTIKKVTRRNNKNYNNELKQLYKIYINNYKPKPKIEKQKPKKQYQKREKNIKNSLINVNDDYSLSLVNVYKCNKFRNN